MQNVTSSLATTTYSTVQMTSMTSQVIQYEWTPYGYDDKTGSFVLTQFKMLMAGGGRHGSDPNACLYYEYFLLNITKGHEIRGHFETGTRPPYAGKGGPVNFYILNLDQLRAFKYSDCGWYPRWSWMLNASASSYDLDWVVPQSGEYALLFLYPDYYYGTIYFKAEDYVRTVQSSTVTYTSTSTNILQNTQIMVLTQSTQPNITPPPSTNYNLLALIALIAIGLIISLITLRKKRKTQG
jgi:hypothetical protein